MKVLVITFIEFIHLFIYIYAFIRFMHLFNAFIYSHLYLKFSYLHLLLISLRILTIMIFVDRDDCCYELFVEGYLLAGYLHLLLILLFISRLFTFIVDLLRFLKIMSIFEYIDCY